MSSRFRVRLLRASKRGEEITVHEDGRLLSQRDTEFGAAAERRAADATEIVELAQRRGEELLRATSREATTVLEEAHRAGREQGYREGAATARAELADQLALVQRIVLDGKALRDRLLAGAERDIVELVIASTRTILGEEVRTNPALVLSTVERALERAGAQNIARIRVNPDDLELVSAQLLERMGERAAAWEVAADGAVTVGGCVIDTASGEVDARLDVQLDEVARVFRSARNGETDSPAEEARRDAA